MGGYISPGGSKKTPDVVTLIGQNKTPGHSTPKLGQFKSPTTAPCPTTSPGLSSAAPSFPRSPPDGSEAIYAQNQHDSKHDSTGLIAKRITVKTLPLNEEYSLEIHQQLVNIPVTLDEVPPPIPDYLPPDEFGLSPSNDSGYSNETQHVFNEPLSLEPIESMADNKSLTPASVTFSSLSPRSRTSSHGSLSDLSDSGLRAGAPPLAATRRESVVESIERQRRESAASRLKGLQIPSRKISTDGSDGRKPTVALPTLGAKRNSTTALLPKLQKRGGYEGVVLRPKPSGLINSDSPNRRYSSIIPLRPTPISGMEQPSKKEQSENQDPVRYDFARPRNRNSWSGSPIKVDIQKDEDRNNNVEGGAIKQEPPPGLPLAPPPPIPGDNIPSGSCGDMSVTKSELASHRKPQTEPAQHTEQNRGKSQTSPVQPVLERHVPMKRVSELSQSSKSRVDAGLSSKTRKLVSNDISIGGSDVLRRKLACDADNTEANQNNSARTPHTDSSCSDYDESGDGENIQITERRGGATPIPDGAPPTPDLNESNPTPNSTVNTNRYEEYSAMATNTDTTLEQLPSKTELLMAIVPDLPTTLSSPDISNEAPSTVEHMDEAKTETKLPKELDPHPNLPTGSALLLDIPTESAPLPYLPTESPPLPYLTTESAPLPDHPTESAPLLDLPTESAPLLDLPTNSNPALDLTSETSSLLDISTQSNTLLELPTESTLIMDLTTETASQQELPTESVSLLDLPMPYLPGSPVPTLPCEAPPPAQETPPPAHEAPPYQDEAPPPGSETLPQQHEASPSSSEVLSLPSDDPPLSMSIMPNDQVIDSVPTLPPSLPPSCPPPPPSFADPGDSVTVAHHDSTLTDSGLVEDEQLRKCDSPNADEVTHGVDFSADELDSTVSDSVVSDSILSQPFPAATSTDTFTRSYVSHSREDLFSEGRGSLVSSPDPVPAPLSPTPSDTDSGIDYNKLEQAKSDVDNSDCKSSDSTPPGTLTSPIKPGLTKNEKDKKSPRVSDLKPNESSSSDSGSTRSRDSGADLGEPSGYDIGEGQGQTEGGNIEVELNKGAVGLGFCIEGGKASPRGDRPITVKRLFKGGAAAHGLLTAGDEIIYANGESLANMTHFQAWTFLKGLPDGPIKMIIKRHN